MDRKKLYFSRGVSSLASPVVMCPRAKTFSVFFTAYDIRVYAGGRIGYGVEHILTWWSSALSVDGDPHHEQ